MQTYEHRQFSPWPLAVAGVAALFGRKASRRTAGSLRTLGFTLFLVQFSVLTTAVDDNRVKWSFGIGFPGGSLALSEVEAVQLTKTQWWDGYGVHWSAPNGWLWNAAGQHAVRIHKRNGKLITLGTDDPQGLYDAIRSRLKG